MDGDRRHKTVRGDGLMGRRRFAVRGGVLLALVGTVFLVFAASAAAATLTVTPANGTATVGQTYCVTATVTGANNPNFVVEFTAQPTSGSGATPAPLLQFVAADSHGQALFCLTSATPGEVLITAVAHATFTMSMPTGTATVTFVAASCDQQGENEGNNPGQCGDQDG